MGVHYQTLVVGLLAYEEASTWSEAVVSVVDKLSRD